MEYRQLGTTGLTVSALGLGANPFGLEVDQETATAIVRRAIDLGVNFFDTANIYHHGKSETMLGNALLGHRHDVVIATKAGGKFDPGPNGGGTSRKHLFQSLDASLARLKTDYVDLFWIHHIDYSTPMEETMDALNDIVRSGKARYIGASNFLAWEVSEHNAYARAAHQAQFVAVQMHYNLIHREVEHEVVPLCQSKGLGFIPYFPMAGGFLTDVYRRDVTPPPGTRGAGRPTFSRWTNDRNWALKDRLEAWANERGHAINDLPVAWLLTRPMLSSIIAGPEKVEHIEANVKAAEWKLTPEEVAEVDAMSAPVGAVQRGN
jgi:aryl-alcohol dehydrogenase-like predicted oxidoreductase